VARAIASLNDSDCDPFAGSRPGSGEMMDLDVHTIAIIGIMAIFPAVMLGWVGYRVLRLRSRSHRRSGRNCDDADGQDEESFPRT